MPSPTKDVYCSKCRRLLQVLTPELLKQYHDSLPSTWKASDPSDIWVYCAQCFDFMAKHHPEEVVGKKCIVIDEAPENLDLSKPPVNRMPNVLDLSHREVIRYLERPSAAQGEEHVDEDQRDPA